MQFPLEMIKFDPVIFFLKSIKKSYISRIGIKEK